MFGVMLASLGYITSGQIRALAVTSEKRQDLLPDTPALAEFLPGYEASGWYGIVAPKGTPPNVVAALNTQIKQTLDDPDVKGRLVELGCNVFGGSLQDFGSVIAPETKNGQRSSSLRTQLNDERISRHE